MSKIILSKLNISSLPEFKNHEMISYIHDEETNLRGFIAIHSTRLGPALGGTRMYPYSSTKEALRDVLRLSHAMTYKCAVAGIHYGGAKGVIIGDPKRDKTKKLLESYANRVDLLGGSFHTGEDVGLSEADVQFMLKISPFFIGDSRLAGDPSPYAALSTFHCIKTALKESFGSDKLKGIRVGIKGVGKVGSELARLLGEEGAEIIIADTDPKAINKTKRLVRNLKVVSSTKIIKEDMEVYAPCALGNEFTATNINNLKASIICGGANNQLSNPAVGRMLFKKKIIYVPDYLANAGGLINVADELEPNGYNKNRVRHRIIALKKTLSNTLRISKSKRVPTNEITDILSQKLMNK